jgi:hypothetical protein
MRGMEGGRDSNRGLRRDRPATIVTVCGRAVPGNQLPRLLYAATTRLYRRHSDAVHAAAGLSSGRVSHGPGRSGEMRSGATAAGS